MTTILRFTSKNSGPLDTPLMAPSDVAHGTCRQRCDNSTWQGCVSQIQCPRAAKPTVHVSQIQCSTYQRHSGPRVASLLVHVPCPYWSMCCLPIGPHASFLLVHVPPSYWSMCRLPISPCVAFLLVHVSPSHWFMCLRSIGPHAAFLLAHVSPSYWSMRFACNAPHVLMHWPAIPHSVTRFCAIGILVGNKNRITIIITHNHNQINV